jgi:hypothetical protein
MKISQLWLNKVNVAYTIIHRGWLILQKFDSLAIKI